MRARSSRRSGVAETLPPVFAVPAPHSSSGAPRRVVAARAALRQGVALVDASRVVPAGADPARPARFLYGIDPSGVLGSWRRRIRRQGGQMSDVTAAAPRDVTRDPRAWLEAHTRAVTHVARRVAQSRGLPADASQALESAVRARLAEDDYEVLRRYRGEADIRTYLAVVASRLLLDQRPEA
jgi:hypothetical protein